MASWVSHLDKHTQINTDWFMVCFPDVLASKQVTVKFVQDTTKFWYKPDISRDQGRFTVSVFCSEVIKENTFLCWKITATSQCFFHSAISVLKDKEPGCFIVRDSHSFRGAYGLAMKVATPPPSVLQQTKKGTIDVNKQILAFCFKIVLLFVISLN